MLMLQSERASKADPHTLQADACLLFDLDGFPGTSLDGFKEQRANFDLSTRNVVHIAHEYHFLAILIEGR